MMVEEERFHSVYRTGNWIAAQTQLEFQRFTGALDRYALGDPTVGRDELIERYDVMWSRFPIVLTGLEAVSIRRVKDVTEGTAEIFEAVKALEDRIVELKPGDRAARAALEPEIAGIAERLQSLIQLAVIDVESYRRASEGFGYSHFELLAYFGLILASGSVVIVLLLREHRAAKRLYDAAGSARHDTATLRADFVTAIDSLKVGLALFDKDERLVLFNPQFPNFFPEIAHQIRRGTTFETLLRAHVAAGRPKGDFASDEEYIQTRMATFRNPTGRHEIEFARGNVMEALEQKTPDGGTVTIRTDITARKLAERERESLIDQFHQAQKMEAIGTLAGGIAHDFNNILTSILGNAALVQFDLSKDHAVQEQLDEILSAGRRAQRLVQQILLVSRAHERRTEAVRLDLVIKETLRMLRATFPATIAFDMRVRADAPTVMADATQIHQVVMNLGVNAGHAIGEKGGTISFALDDVDIDDVVAADLGRATDGKSATPLRTSIDADGNARLWLGMLKPGPHIKLTVRDDGAGMDAQTLERIFDPFFTTKGIGKGTGLGLAAVQGIVLASGGALSVSTAPGKGAAFKIMLPSTAEAAAMPVARATGALRAGSGGILFIDDEPSLVRIGQRTLERAGYKVDGFTDSIAALEAFRAAPGRWDLIVTDQTMPNLTGINLAREIIAERPDMPIILCTGFSDSIDDDIVRAAGIREFVMKPIAGTELAELVEKVMKEGAKAPAA